MNTTTPTSPTLEASLRPLRPEDLSAVVELDRLSSGTSRRGYFEKRLQAALRKPREHLQYALTAPQGLIGFLLARRAGGEYGRPDEVVVLETIGVDLALRRHGLGQRMLAGLEQWMGAHAISSLVTQVDWRNHSMLKFLAGAGFRLAPRAILERSVERVSHGFVDDEDLETMPPVVRSLKASDFDAVVRIDQRITGQDRSKYLTRKFDEVLNESAIEVSLIGEADGFPVAFAMARVDFGDFGHVEPSASLDTIGVDPRFARQGYGRAVLSQMVQNLAALHVERLETEVASESFALLRFLFDLGFGPSARLSFVRAV